MLDERQCLLLFQFEDPNVRDPHDPRGADRPARFWATPGGGVEGGESLEEAACRELLKETGLVALALDTALFEREILLLINGEPVLQLEHYFLVHIPAAEVSLHGLTPLEQRVFRAHRWWTLDELEQTTEDVFPEGLATIIRKALAGA